MTNSRGGGASDGFPSGVPPSTQAASVAISLSVMRRSLRNGTPSVIFHGGIWWVDVYSLMSSHQLTACLKVISEKGPTCPGRWHSWQRLCRIGATSR